MHPNDGRVISNFIVQALKNQVVTVYGDGSQTRSFCYVDDMIDGLIRGMNGSDNFTGPVNLGNPSEECSILELAEKVVELTNSESEIRFEPLPEDDPRQRQPDITLARQTLGWESKVPLEQGLKQAIAYFKELLHSVSS